jgi:hypothetical protein
MSERTLFCRTTRISGAEETAPQPIRIQGLRTNKPIQEIKNIRQRKTTKMMPAQMTTRIQMMQEGETNHSMQEIKNIHQIGTT